MAQRAQSKNVEPNIYLSCFHITNSLRRNVTTQRDNERSKIPLQKALPPFIFKRGIKGDLKLSKKPII